MLIIMLTMAAGARAVAAPAVVIVPPPPPPPIPIVAPRRLPEPILFLDLPPPATELPKATRDLIEAAFDAGDDATVTALFKLARRTNPQASRQIDALEAEISARRAEKIALAARERADRLAAASFIDNWKGEIELGGSRSTGNTKSTSFYGALSLDREGLSWQHSIKARLDFQRSNKNTTADRSRIIYQPSYKVNDGMFVYGLGQYERDRFRGFSSRYTVSTGVGFTLISTPDVKFNIQGGPAGRHVARINEADRTTAAGRASLALRWKIAPTLSLNQDAAIYLEKGDTNGQSTTSLETRLLGKLKARFSYDVQYEDRKFTGREPLDTISRATLVYGF
jgi:putative salt-induced outer membrane protein